MLNSPQKQLFWSGLILITLTLTSNALLSKWLISEREQQVQTQVQQLTRTADHMFTALTYLEHKKPQKFAKELERVRKQLRSSVLVKLRKKEKNKGP